MSIILDEAQAYEDSRNYDCCQIIDGAFTVGCAVNEAYCEGRSAPPADVEVEAVARKLMWWDVEPAWNGDMPSEDFFWNQSEPEMRANYLKDAREMLEIARKAVTES